MKKGTGQTERTDLLKTVPYEVNNKKLTLPQEVKKLSY